MNTYSRTMKTIAALPAEEQPAAFELFNSGYKAGFQAALMVSEAERSNTPPDGYVSKHQFVILAILLSLAIVTPLVFHLLMLLLGARA